MKNKLTFFFLTCFSFILYSQSSGVVTYGQKIIIPNDTNSLKKSEFATFYNKEKIKMSVSSKNIIYKLQFNKHAASFTSEKHLSIDGFEDDVKYAMLHVRGDGTYYFSLESGISLWDHDVFGERVILVDTISPKDWTITKETKMIDKYMAVKAKKNKRLNNGKIIEVFAWFTPEIANNYGPIGYYGLPGLILEIHEKDFIIYAKNIKFKKKAPKINKPSKGTYMGEKEYKIYVDKAAKNFIAN
ncbi:GLPGLI family protein [Yeosuana sp. AK3]